MLARPDRLGDVVITTACLEEIHRQLPHTRLIFAVKRPFAFMFEGNPLLSDCIQLDDVEDIPTLTEQLRQTGADAIVHLNPCPPLEQAAVEAGIPIRLGYSRKHGERLTGWLPYQWKKTGQQHEALYNFDLLEPFGISSTRNLSPLLMVPQGIENRFEYLFKPGPVALFHLASFGNKPRVPASFFAQIAQKLLSSHIKGIILVGADSDDPSVLEFLDLMHHSDKIQNLAGKTQVEELTALCKKASLMISRDSGPAHLSAALGCPTLTFFINPTPLMSPVRWHPLGPAVEIYTKPIISLPFEPPHRLARRIIQYFDADEAFQAALKVMQKDQRI